MDDASPEGIATQYEQTAAELDQAAQHLRTSAQHVRDRAGVGIGAHAFAACGHLRRADRTPRVACHYARFAVSTWLGVRHASVADHAPESGGPSSSRRSGGQLLPQPAGAVQVGEHHQHYHRPRHPRHVDSHLRASNQLRRLLGKI